MFYPAENIPKTWLFITILMLWSVTLCVTSEDKTINLKIGFDLTKGSNGAQSLRIRDFEDTHGYNPRAVEGSSEDEGEEVKKSSPSLRADSWSSSSEETDKGKKEHGDSSGEESSGLSGNDSNGDERRSTQGMGRDEAEPDDNPKLHSKHESNSESDEESNRRRKRNSGNFETVKRKNKKSKTARKQAMSV